MFGDCEHEVETVQRGLRLTIAYDIFLDPSSGDIDESINTKTTLSEAMFRALRDPEGFAPNGCTLAFGLKHAYPRSKGSFLADLGSHLKGPDAALLQIVKTLGLNTSFKAVYPRREYDDYDVQDPVEHARLLESRKTNVETTRERHGLRKHRVRLGYTTLPNSNVY